jgi:hypothetical protein
MRAIKFARGREGWVKEMAAFALPPCTAVSAEIFPVRNYQRENRA